MRDWPNKLPGIIFAVVLHAALIAALFFGGAFEKLNLPELLGLNAMVEQPGVEPPENPVEALPEIIEATTVDAAQLDAELNRVRDRAAARQEEKAQLQRDIEATRNERAQEEARLSALRAEQQDKLLENQRAEAERQLQEAELARMAEERKALELEQLFAKQELARRQKAAEKAEQQRQQAEKDRQQAEADRRQAEQDRRNNLVKLEVDLLRAQQKLHD